MHHLAALALHALTYHHHHHYHHHCRLPSPPHTTTTPACPQEPAAFQGYIQMVRSGAIQSTYMPCQCKGPCKAGCPCFDRMVGRQCCVCCMCCV
jgi:hypothetical protein